MNDIFTSWQDYAAAVIVAAFTLLPLWHFGLIQALAPVAVAAVAVAALAGAVFAVNYLVVSLIERIANR